MVLGLGNSLTSLYTPGEAAVYIATTSFDLDGGDDHINLGNSWSLKGRATDTSSGVGISCGVWFKPDDIQSTGQTNPIVNCIQFPGGWAISYNNTRIEVGLNRGDAGRDANMSISSGWRTLGTDASPLRASNWHHVGMTFDGRYLKTYLNGSQYGSSDAGSDDNYIHHNSGGAGGATQPTCMSVGDVDLLIGADPNNLTNSGGCGVPGTAAPSGACFEGLINEVGVWNKVLSEECFSEIFEAVNTGGSVLDLTKDSGDYTNSGDLVGLYRGDSIDGTTATNVADAGTHDGSMKNGIGTSSTVPS
tara:strand:- start:855 stop:1766 length:912 start_codon:yes stop_codon:yes gene_type:complete